MFPDANLASDANKEKLEDLTSKCEANPRYQKFVKKLNLMKASATDNNGLLNKLAVCMSVVNELGPTRAIAQLWKEFLLELRFRYESSCFIPGLSSANESNKVLTAEKDTLTPPDLSRCLLHQKLQMLNCCIKKKLERQRLEINNYLEMKERQDSLQNSGGEDDEDEDDEDSFFDAEEEVVESTRPEGRLKKFGHNTLLADPIEPIYVPITQVSAPNDTTLYFFSSVVS